MKKLTAILLTAIQMMTGAAAVAEADVQSPKEKALALIGTFASGDAKLAASLLDENYIQHNLAYGTGRDAFVGSVNYLASAPGEKKEPQCRTSCFP